MIPKGLKVGDTFVDDGRTYKLLKVVGENYERAWVGATPPKTLVADNSTEQTSADVDYENYPYATLKKLCAERGLDAKGSKADLIARLEG
jgi:hypothetical protein